MPLPGGFPYGLGIPEGAGGGTYTPTGFAYNFAIGGLPFLSAASRENPMVETTAPYRKQQFDSNDTPGEQSLDGWWLRSQQTFHGGAGQLYYDRSASDAAWAESRFYRSKGVDPWTPGQLTLLHRLDALTSSDIKKIVSDGVRAVGMLDDDESIFYVDENGSYTADDLPVLPDLYLTKQDVAMDSSRLFFATDTVIYRADLDDALPIDTLTGMWFTIESGADFPDRVILGWVKERLVVATDFGVYEITDFGGPVDYLPAANWRPPQGTWIPKSITESNSAIYVAGVLNGERSVILKFTLDDAGAMPVLTSGTVVANLPYGETIEHIYGYLGRYMAISTDRGPRIAIIDDNGDLTIGPILFDGAVGNWVARGQYLYAPAVLPEWEAGEGGLVRVDLGLQLSELRFAYASDLWTPESGAANSVGMVGAGIIVGGQSGLFLENEDQYVDDGWLLSGRVRYSTLEPKVFKLLRVRGGILESDFAVSVVDDNDAEHDVVGYVEGQTPGVDDVPIPSVGPQDHLSVKIHLFSDGTHEITPTVGGWQLKALPGQPRQRLIVLPLHCWDLETDRGGRRAGTPGSARARLRALQEIERSGDTLVMQDLDGNDSVTVSIDEVLFTQTAPPTGGMFAGWGGIITLTLRTVF
jgi:hypothetical protein